MKRLNLRNLFLLFTFTASVLTTSCSSDDDNGDNGGSSITGEGPIVTQTLSIADFAGVNLATSPNVTIKQGATQAVSATGQANIIAVLTTDVTDNVWEIGFNTGINGNFDLTIEIIVPTINTIVASSSGNIDVNNFTNQNDNLSIETTSSGSITLNQFDGIASLDATTSSSGSIFANADISSLENLTINLSSNGNYEGFALSGNACTINSSSGGKVELTANNTLNATIESSGDVYYKGNPTITQNITSSGQLIDAN